MKSEKSKVSDERMDCRKVESVTYSQRDKKENIKSKRVKVKAYELRKKNRQDLEKQLDELKN